LAKVGSHGKSKYRHQEFKVQKSRSNAVLGWQRLIFHCIKLNWPCA